MKHCYFSLFSENPILYVPGKRNHIHYEDKPTYLKNNFVYKIKFGKWDSLNLNFFFNIQQITRDVQNGLLASLFFKTFCTFKLALCKMLLLIVSMLSIMNCNIYHFWVTVVYLFKNILTNKSQLKTRVEQGSHNFLFLCVLLYCMKYMPQSN